MRPYLRTLQLLSIFVAMLMSHLVMAAVPVADDVASKTLLRRLHLFNDGVFESLSIVTDSYNFEGPGSHGQSFVFHGSYEEAVRPVTLNTRGLNVKQAVARICNQAGLDFRIEKHAIFVGNNLPTFLSSDTIFSDPRMKYREEVLFRRIPEIRLWNDSIEVAATSLDIKLRRAHGDEPRLQWKVEGPIPKTRNVRMVMRNMPYAKIAQYIAFFADSTCWFDPDGVVFSPNWKVC